MKRLSLAIILVLSFLIILQVGSAIPTFVNPQGTIAGPCSPYAQVSVYAYCPGGSPFNASCSIDNSTATATSGGIYATSVTYDNAIYPLGIDILVVANNQTCSLVANGSNTITSEIGPSVPTINVNISNAFTLTSPSNGSTIADNTTTFTWSNSLVNPNYTLVIDDDSDFSSPVLNLSNITLQTYTMPTELADNTYYWYVVGNTDSTFVQQSATANFILSTASPQIIGISPDNDTWIGSTTTTLSINTTLAANCAYATSSGVAFGAKTLFTTTGTTTHSTTVTLAAEDNNTFYLQCNGTSGGLMGFDNVTEINRDTTAPVAGAATVTVNGGAVYATNNSINLTWSGFTDASSGIVNYYLNTTNNQGTTSGLLDAASPGILTGVAEGVITAYVWAVDAAGNIGLAASDSITVDTTGPTFGGFSSNPANINQFTTSSYQFFLTVSDSSPLNNFPQVIYRIGNDAYTTPENMTLVGGSIYSFTIPNQAAPNDWASRTSENLTFIVNATDIQGFNSSITLSEFINDQDTVPTFDVLSDAAVSQGSTLQITLSGNDADGNTLTYTSNFTGFTITQDNASVSTASWTPSNSDVGSQRVLFNLTDGTTILSQEITVTVTNVNDDPVLGSIGDQEAYEYKLYNLTINATDPDGDNLTFSTNSTFFSVSSTSGLVRFTPIASHRGEHTIQFSVNDGNGGADNETIVFTVLYCGDSVCSEDYESESSCAIDCEDVEDQDSQGFIISSKTCLGDIVDIHAVELVKRTTCETQGVIINDLETCGNVSTTTVNIEQKIDNIYVAIESLLTDDYGKTSYRPNETGQYRVRYDSTDFDENLQEFTVRECTDDGTSTSVSSGTSDTQDFQEQEVELPLFEEPQEITQTVVLSQARKIVYFVLLPLLFVLAVVASVTTYYNYGRRKGGNQFTSEIDVLKEQVRTFVRNTKDKITGSPTYKKLLPYLKEVERDFKKISNVVLTYLEPLFFLKKINVPYYPIKVGAHREQDMVLLSLLSYEYKGKNFETFLEALEREKKQQAANPRIFAMQAKQFGVPLQYHFSVTKDKDELIALHQVTKVEKSYPTITDIKLHLMKGKPVVVPLHMNALNHQAPRENFYAVIRGFDKKGFYMLDYSFSRKHNTLVPYQVFKKAWESSGYLECFIVKK